MFVIWSKTNIRNYSVQIIRAKQQSKNSIHVVRMEQAINIGKRHPITVMRAVDTFGHCTSSLKKILNTLPKILWSYRMTPTLLQCWCLQVMAYDWGQSRASSFFWAWTYYCSYLPYTPSMHDGTCGYKKSNSHIWKHPCIPVFDVNPTLLEFFRSNFDNKTQWNTIFHFQDVFCQFLQNRKMRIFVPPYLSDFL